MPGSEDMPVLSGLPDDYRQPKQAVDHEIQPILQLNVGSRVDILPFLDQTREYL